MTAQNESFGTQEYFAAELQSETPWRRLDAARTLADRAVSNFERRLQADYNTTLGVNAEDTEDDELMIAEVKAECENLRRDLIASLQTPSQSDIHQAKDHNGLAMSPLQALFAIATVEDTDLFLDITQAENPFSLGDQIHNLKDGAFDRYGFNINDQSQRQRALQAMYTESRNNQTLFAQQVA